MAAILSLMVLIRMFLMRKQRRGFGLALVAFVFLWASTAFFSEALDDAKRVAYVERHMGSGADYRHRPWSRVRGFPRSLIREIPK